MAKIGDKVECISNKNPNPTAHPIYTSINIGNIYEVELITSDSRGLPCYKFRGLLFDYYPQSNFKDVPTVKAAAAYDMLDIDDSPYDRGDNVLCLNCKTDWGYHMGWRCPGVDARDTRLSKLPEDKRYLTHDMVVDRNNQTPTATIVSSSPSVPEWKVWRDHGRLPGHCVCEVLQSECKYHKDLPSHWQKVD